MVFILEKLLLMSIKIKVSLVSIQHNYLFFSPSQNMDYQNMLHILFFINLLKVLTNLTPILVNIDMIWMMCQLLNLSRIFFQGKLKKME